MSKYFPKLTQTHVWIEDGSGSGFSCPMLPVSKIGELNEFSEALARIKTIDDGAKAINELAKVRDRMVDLAKTVIPEQYHPNLMRLNVPALTELITYLMYGDNDDQPPAEAKKN